MAWFRKKKQQPEARFTLDQLPSGDLDRANPDWLMVAGVDEHRLQHGIVEMSGLCGCAYPKPHTFSIYAMDGGRFAVAADPPIPPYDAMNLAVWLAGVGSEIGASYAVAWLTALGSGTRYGLYPDMQNERGDTLLGYTSDGDAVSAYAPEATMRLCSNEVLRPEEPAFPTGEPVLSFTLELDHDPSFGNPELAITHAPDEPWVDHPL